MTISFGDNVKILNSEQTDKAGLSGKIGEVLGETSPSSTGVTFFGNAKDDYVINVAFTEPDSEYWFTPELLELVNQEVEADNIQMAVENIKQKKWWQIWK